MTGILTPYVGSLGSVTSGHSLSGDWSVSGDFTVGGGSPWYDVKHPDFGGVGDGVADDADAIQAAVSAAGSAGGTIFLPQGTYLAQSSTSPTASVRFRGAGRDATTVKAGSGIASTWLFRKSTTSNVDGIEFSDMTFDLNNVAAASGVWLEYVTRASFRRCRFTNVAASGWGCLVGVTNGADSTVRNSDILFEDCVFDGLAGSLEQLLLFNSRRVRVRNCHFTNVTGSAGHSIGLFQLLEDVTIDSCSFEPVTGGALYYGVTTQHTKINNCNFKGNGITGANDSDNGTFSQTHARDLQVTGNTFENGTQQLQLGAVRGARVIGNQFLTAVDNALVIDDGPAPIAQRPDDLIIAGNQFRNNGTSNTAHVLHPGILFQSIGGSQHVEINGNEFFDDQATKTQRFPITFEGAFTWSDISIVNNRLLPDVANGGQSIAVNNGAAMGTNFRIVNNRDYTSSPSTINAYVDQMGTGSPAATLAAGIGSVWHRLDGGAATSIYIKESGAGTTAGWVAK